MTAKEALQIIFSHIQKEPVVCATGYICRSVQAVSDRPQNFYMIGSMGMVSSLAMGLAIAKPKQKVIAMDGDGAVLMNLGMLPTIGALQPDNFIHIVLDNQSYESTGGQPSLTQTIQLENIARASGYAWTGRAETPVDLKREMASLFKQKGPSFLLVRISQDTSTASPRVQAEPEAITENFRNSLS